MELGFAAATDVGKVRSSNEDQFLVDKRLRLFMVADGMGGHAAGEVASSVAVHEVRDALTQKRDLIERYRADGDEISTADILGLMEQALASACAKIHAMAEADPSKRGMGTTSTVLLIAGGGDVLRGFVAHVGDSRLYVTRQGQSHQLTEDHSLKQELIKRGKVSKEAFDQSPYRKYKNAVTRAVGIYPSVAIDTFDFDILPGDNFLLCSDGLHAYLQDGDLARLHTATPALRELPTSLIAHANAGGGHDNITCVVVRAGEPRTRADSHASQKLDVLKNTVLFRHVAYKELLRVASMASRMPVAANATIFEEGTPGDAMYVVLAGKIELRRGNQPMLKLRSGEHFGELALIDSSPRSMAAVALVDSQLLVITRDAFFDVVRSEPPIAVKMLWSLATVLSTRLRKTTSDLSDALSERGNDTLIEPAFPNSDD